MNNMMLSLLRFKKYDALLDSYEPRWESRISLMAQGANCAGEVDGKKRRVVSTQIRVEK